MIIKVEDTEYIFEGHKNTQEFRETINEIFEQGKVVGINLLKEAICADCKLKDNPCDIYGNECKVITATRELVGES